MESVDGCGNISSALESARAEVVGPWRALEIGTMVVSCTSSRYC